MAGSLRSAWPALCSHPGSGPATAAASAPVTDRRAGPAGTGRGPSVRRGLPRAPVTDSANSGPHPRLSWPGTARHSPARPSGTTRKLIPGPRPFPRASSRAPEQAMERCATRGPRRTKAPPLRTLGSVVRPALSRKEASGGVAGGNTWIRDPAELRLSQAYRG